MERLIVDTGVLVGLERGRIDPDVVPDDADVAIAAITASELLVGVELAEDSHRHARSAMVDAVLSSFEILPFDLEVARCHATLLAHARRTGRPRGAHDLLIAATAAATGRIVITTDRRAFDDLPGVRYRLARDR